MKHPAQAGFRVGRLLNTAAISKVPEPRVVELPWVLERLSLRLQRAVEARLEKHGRDVQVTIEQRRSFPVACFLWKGVCLYIVQFGAARPLGFSQSTGA